MIKKEAALLEDTLGVEIKSVSMHRPSKMTLDADYDLSPLVNSYGKKFFRDYKYVSDSRMRWREDVEDIIKSEKYDKLHILTHAFLYREREESLHDLYKKHINSANTERYRALEKNMTDLSSVVNLEEVK